MGGRGSSSGFVSRLPNYQRAEILHSKIKNYLLNPKKSNGKYQLFKGLGYTVKNSARLEQDIRRGLKENKARQYAPNAYGHVVYNVSMTLGIGETASILTVWQVDKGSNKPRFITAYKDHRGGKNND